MMYIWCTQVFFFFGYNVVECTCVFYLRQVVEMKNLFYLRQVVECTCLFHWAVGQVFFFFYYVLCNRIDNQDSMFNLML